MLRVREVEPYSTASQYKVPLSRRTKVLRYADVFGTSTFAFSYLPGPSCALSDRTRTCERPRPLPRLIFVTRAEQDRLLGVPRRNEICRWNRRSWVCPMTHADQRGSCCHTATQVHFYLKGYQPNLHLTPYLASQLSISCTFANFRGSVSSLGPQFTV